MRLVLQMLSTENEFVCIKTHETLAKKPKNRLKFTYIENFTSNFHLL